MRKDIREALLDLKARQEKGEYTLCPRCGRKTMKPDLYTNALSRHADGIYICDECGQAEAMLDFMQNPLPVECWAFFREGWQTEAFRDVPGDEAEKIILDEHLPRLIDGFRNWHDGAVDFEDLGRALRNSCPGISEIYQNPFSVVYKTKTNRIYLRFRMNGSSVEYAIDHIT